MRCPEHLRASQTCYCYHLPAIYTKPVPIRSKDSFQKFSKKALCTPVMSHKSSSRIDPLLSGHLVVIKRQITHIDTITHFPYIQKQNNISIVTTFYRLRIYLKIEFLMFLYSNHPLRRRQPSINMCTKLHR